jgi:hypothetical protein
MITRVLLPHRENIIDLTPRAPAQPRARLQCWKGCRTIAESYDWLGGRMRRAYGDRRGPRREDPHLEAKKSWESPEASMTKDIATRRINNCKEWTSDEGERLRQLVVSMPRALASSYGSIAVIVSPALHGLRGGALLFAETCAPDQEADTAYNSKDHDNCEWNPASSCLPRAVHFGHSSPLLPPAALQNNPGTHR